MPGLWPFNKFNQPKNSITTSRDLAEALGYDGYGQDIVRVSPNQAMAISSVQSAVRCISETTGILPFPIYQRDDKVGKKYARDHYLWRLLNNKPNAWMTSQQFIETMTAWYLMFGAARAFKNSIDGKVKELLPIHPSRIRKEQDKNWNIKYTVNLIDGSTKVFAPEHIFEVSDLSIDAVNGMSRVRECALTFGLTKSMEEYAGTFFKNSSIPTGVLSTEQNVNAEDVKKIRESWKAGHAGGERRGTAVLDQGFQFKTITQTAEESQQLESRKFQVTETARVFRLPPHKIGDLERATFSNIEQQDLDFVKGSMMPHFRRWENAVDTQLIKESDQDKYYSKINDRALLRGDSNSRGAFYLRMRQGKIMTANEIRDLEDLPPINGGDILENPSTTPGDPIKDDKEDKGGKNANE